MRELKDHFLSLCLLGSLYVDSEGKNVSIHLCTEYTPGSSEVVWGEAVLVTLGPSVGGRGLHAEPGEHSHF